MVASKSPYQLTVGTVASWISFSLSASSDWKSQKRENGLFREVNRTNVEAVLTKHQGDHRAVHSAKHN